MADGEAFRVRLGLAVIVLYFGSSLSAYKLAGESFGPATTNLIRFVVASALLLVAARPHLRDLRGNNEFARRVVPIGMFGLGLMALLMAMGVDEGSAIIASVIVGLEPIGVAIAGMLIARDRLTARALIALTIGFAGALVASGLFTERTGPSPITPVVLLLGTVATFSIYTARVRTVARGFHPLATAAMTQVGALVFVIPACALDLLRRDDVTEPVTPVLAPLRGMIRGEIGVKALLAALFIGVGSAISYLLLCQILAGQPSSRLAVTLYLTPVIGVLCSWIVVGEPLHWRDAVGGALVLAAVAVSEFRRRAVPAPSELSTVA